MPPTPQPHSYLLVRRNTDRGEQVLLAQRNLYLPPTERYPFAALALHATQYVLPGGAQRAGEQPLEAAVRELGEDTGVEIPILTVRLLCVVGERSFYEVRDPSGIDLGLINSSLRDGSARSAKTQNMAWVAIESAASWMGMKTEYQYLPWVTEQIMRAVKAGFTKEMIQRRVMAPHDAFVEALNRALARRG
jgi:ADP-ribose pyrophosphatase YjhB (NUDIX family)